MPGQHKQVSCNICFKPMRSNNLKRHTKVHIVHTAEIQVENSEEIFRDIVNDIIDKMFEQENTVKDDNHQTTKRKLSDDKDDQSVIKRKCNEIDVEALEKMLKEETSEYDRKIDLGKAIEKILEKGEVEQAALSKDI